MYHETFRQLGAIAYQLTPPPAMQQLILSLMSMIHAETHAAHHPDDDCEACDYTINYIDTAVIHGLMYPVLPPNVA